jgi:hypothetical protein
MQQKQLPELLIDYVNWRSRYVGQRPRTVTVEPATKADPRWSMHAAAIGAFIDKVRRGDDLDPHLSIKPHTQGYAPAARAPGATIEDRWSDKDFLLNTMGYHHFHLGTATQKHGHVDRTGDLIFAKVHRDTFKVIAIFGHEVFEQNSTERMRLWSVHEEIVFRGVPPGSAVVEGLIATSGHNLHVVHYAQECAKIIRDYERKLDDPNFVKRLYPSGERAPAKPKFEWSFRHLDLLLRETVEPRLFPPLQRAGIRVGDWTQTAALQGPSASGTARWCIGCRGRNDSAAHRIYRVARSPSLGRR